MKEFYPFYTGPEIKKHDEPLQEEIIDVLSHYEAAIAVPQVINIGPITTLEPRFEGDEAPQALREYTVAYPPTLNEAYAILAQKHDEALMKIVDTHKEWNTDYQFAPASLAFQIDGPAYPDTFLTYAATKSPQVLAGFLKGRIYEAENNIAGYDLNGRLWPEGTTSQTWHQTLDIVRHQTGKKIAVLASTNEKYHAILLSELGVTKDHIPDPEKIREVSGFDAFWGPDELYNHYRNNNGVDSEYVFFGRTSRSTNWLENPSTPVIEPFLDDPVLRKYVRAYAITHNFDNPSLGLHDPKVLTDTKAALCMIGAAHFVNSPEDIYAKKFLEFLIEKRIDLEKVLFREDITESKKKKLGKNLDKYFFDYPRVAMLNPHLISHLKARGIDPNTIANGSELLRAKPLRRHYGAWGHIRGRITGSTFIRKFVQETDIRGPFAIQPELKNLEVIDSNTGTNYLAIDRVFLIREIDGKLKRMEGIRAHMPKNSPEGQKNAVHDGKFTLDAAIATG